DVESSWRASSWMTSSIGPSSTAKEQSTASGGLYAMPLGPRKTITPCGMPHPLRSGRAWGGDARYLAPLAFRAAKHATGSTSAALSHCGDSPFGKGLAGEGAPGVGAFGAVAPGGRGAPLGSVPSPLACAKGDARTRPRATIPEVRIDAR